MQAHTIFFVEDQAKATRFYEQLLGLKPQLEVPGMSELRLSTEHVLGLMPVRGAQRLFEESKLSLGDRTTKVKGELYLYVTNPGEYLERAQALGATLVSAVCRRTWGDDAGYALDLDGHLLGFAKKNA